MRLFKYREVNFEGPGKEIAQVNCIFGLFKGGLSDIKNTFVLCH